MAYGADEVYQEIKRDEISSLKARIKELEDGIMEQKADCTEQGYHTTWWNKKLHKLLKKGGE